MVPEACLTASGLPLPQQLAGSVQAGFRGSEVCFQLAAAFSCTPRSGGGTWREA